MITEGFVNLEIGKLLKEKGFDEFCFCINYPLPDGSPHSIIVPNLISNSMLPSVNEFRFCKYKEDLITIPTLQMTMEWLRKIHKIDITIDPHEVCGEWIYQFHLCKNRKYLFSRDIDMSYKNCTMAAIKYCLENLI